MDRQCWNKLNICSYSLYYCYVEYDVLLLFPATRTPLMMYVVALLIPNRKDVTSALFSLNPNKGDFRMSGVIVPTFLSSCQLRMQQVMDPTIIACILMAMKKDSSCGK